MPKDPFFAERREQSKIKSLIVAKFFSAWANVIKGTARQRAGRLAYIDLFAGPGRYDDGSKSTPLLVLETAIKDNALREMLVTIFNDADGDYVKSLEQEISRLSGVGTLKHKPIVFNFEVGSKIVEMFETYQLVPTFFFVDPFGYRGLSLKLINSVLKNWGSDCVIFFNYNRINMGLSNSFVREHMNALFGESRADILRQRLESMLPDEREVAIVEEIAQALKEMGGEYVLPFRFRNEAGKRTSHHLIFVSKHPLGYEIMKDIMAGYSSSTPQGVPSFEYSPASDRQPLLFEMSRPLDDLADMLLSHFSGRRITMQSIFREHNVGRPYIKRNYKAVLNQLESEGKIVASPPADKRVKRKGEITFGDDTLVTFPKKS